MNSLESLRAKIDMIKQKCDQAKREADMEKEALHQIESDLGRMEADKAAKIHEVKCKSDRKAQIQQIIMQSEQALGKMQQSATQLTRAMDDALGQ
ncbi:unnamed protein product [Moneuplotes crassus]|uniref:Uncharacterized protein n=1 Tax=Euplotes crassus TaxID=5936 RepID=A0AAD1Y8V7_EUPCR|nr:unnamed protein product [Moneuplotes crassus]